jgi:DNA-directed RNA polymerase subunit RPC12/RpoP
MLSARERADVDMPTGKKSLLLRCVQCGELYAGSPTNNGDLIPDGAASGGRCHHCGHDEFEQVTLPASD